MNRKLVLLMIWAIVLIGMLVPATVSAEISVSVKAGDWIEYKITYTSELPPPEKYQTWIEIEILSVQETSVTLDFTVEYSDGTQETTKLTIERWRVIIWDFSLFPQTWKTVTHFTLGMRILVT